MIDELESRIREIDESGLLHTEESDTISRAKSVLERSEYAIILSTHSLEKEHDIDEMFERFWS